MAQRHLCSVDNSVHTWIPLVRPANKHSNDDTDIWPKLIKIRLPFENRQARDFYQTIKIRLVNECRVATQFVNAFNVQSICKPSGPIRVFTLNENRLQWWTKNTLQMSLLSHFVLFITFKLRWIFAPSNNVMYYEFEDFSMTNQTK